MINQLLIICFTIFTYEFIRLIKLTEIIKSNLMTYKDLIKLFKIKKISDTKQEKIVFNFAKSLFFFSIKIFLALFSIILIVLLLNLFSNSFLNFAVSILGAIEITIIFAIYHKLRKLIYEKL